MKCIGSIILVACLSTNSQFVLGQSPDAEILPLEPSPHNINVLATDSSGFLWIGTGHGLYRHERTSLRQFLHDPEDPSSLSDNRIFALAVDREGFVWVGTREGLNRLDPETWSITRYVNDPDDPASLPGHAVTALLVDRHNQLWVGTFRELVKLDRSKGRFVRFDHTIDRAGAVIQRAVSTIAEDRSGRIWFGSWGGFGVGRFDERTGEYVHFPVWGPHYVEEVMESVRKRMADPIAALARVGNSQDLSESFSLSHETRVLVVSEIDKLSIRPNDVGWIEDATGGTVWNANDARCLHGGGAARNLLCIEESTLARGSYTLRYRSNESHAFGDWSAAPPIEQDWWGISVLPAPATSLGRLLTSERIDSRSLPTNPSRMYTVDDSVWIVTDAGAMMYEPRSDTLAPNLYGERTGWMALDAEHLFVGETTSEGFAQVTRVDRRTGSRTSWQTTSAAGFTQTHRASDGSFWLAGEGVFVIPSSPRPFGFLEAADVPKGPCNDRMPAGSVAYDLKIGAWKQSVSFDVEVTGSVMTEEGICWIGTTHGIYRVEGDDVTQFLPDEMDPNAIVGARVTDIIENTNGTLWASTVNDDRPDIWGGSVNRFDGKKFEVFDLSALVKGDRPFDLHPDAGGSIWVAFANGLAKIVNDGAEFRPYLMPSNVGTLVVSESPDGRLWLGDYDGSVFTLNKATEEFELLRAGGLQEWGLPRALQLEADRAMWGAFDGFGLVRFDLSSGVQRAFTELDGLASTSFKHLGSHELPDGTLLFETDDGAVTATPIVFRSTPRYPPVIADVDTERMETLRFRVLSSAYTTPTILQVRVPDLIKDWRSVTPGERVELERVPAARYTIEARELPVAGEGKTARAEVRVREFFWKAEWFRWLVGALVLAVLYSFYLARVRHRQQLVDVRRRIARDLHDEVGSQVAGIKLMADLARDESLTSEARTAEIEEISHTATDLVDALKEISWFIRSDDDRMNHLLDRMRTYAARHLRGMQLVFQANDEEVTPYLPDRGRREFILIFREAVRNCAQHSGASTVSIDFRLEAEDGTLLLEIEDDGVGFDVNGSQKGLGLRAMADRAKILNGALAVESTPGVGTKLTLTIPVEVPT